MARFEDKSRSGAWRKSNYNFGVADAKLLWAENHLEQTFPSRSLSYSVFESFTSNIES